MFSLAWPRVPAGGASRWALQAPLQVTARSDARSQNLSPVSGAQSLVQAPAEGPKVVAGRRGLGATPRPEGEPVNDELPRGLWWAFKRGRKPTALYVDNGSCFISKEFRPYCEGQGIRVIYGRPYNPRGRVSSSGSMGFSPRSSWVGCGSVRSATSDGSSTIGGGSTTSSASMAGSAGRPRPRCRTTEA